MPKPKLTSKPAEEQQDNSRVPPQLQPHVFKKGQSGNPSGRPSGTSLKEYAKMMLNRMTDDEREEFLNGLDKRIIWEMAEGKAEAKSTIEATLEHKIAIDPKAEQLIDELIS